jgi:hypothetical protein
MTQPATRMNKKLTAAKDDDFDFEQSSDLCDFGFVLIKTEDQPTHDPAAQSRPVFAEHYCRPDGHRELRGVRA